MPLDRDRLEKDAQYLLDVYDHPSVDRVAKTILAALEDPLLLVPEGYALVKKPELLRKGVPAR